MAPWLRAACVVFVLAAQLPGGFLALSPFRGARLAAAALQLPAALLGALTGAGAGAPALVLAALCLSLLDDAQLSALCTRGRAPAAAAAAGAKPVAAGGAAAGEQTPAPSKGRARRDSLDELLASPRYHGGCSDAFQCVNALVGRSLWPVAAAALEPCVVLLRRCAA